jgi:hypothetical protein
VIRMDQTRMAKKSFESKTKSIRNVGRPRWRCLEDAENDLRERKVERWGQQRRTSACREGSRGS